MAARIIITKQGEDYQVSFKSNHGISAIIDKSYKDRAGAYKGLIGFIVSLYTLGGIKVIAANKLQFKNKICVKFNTGNSVIINIADKTNRIRTTKPRIKQG